MADRTVLQYELLEKLGAGGMGEVYKARDTRLNRFVAMKTLPAGMSVDPESRRRFIQEAQAASALNHPNIITIYDIISDGDTQYMVMEYVAGKTLRDLIPQDGLRVPQVIQYATQMAEALSAAHAAGIIHRDLKPANVMVTGNGFVKLLDFGLAKLFDAGPVDDMANTTTQAQLTVEGILKGTVNYMSPEQAEGRKLHARSDIFSFGAVLYEMLTGRAAFRGNSTLSILSAVLRDEVQPIMELCPDTPFELDQIVVQCLRKDPNQRFQSMQAIQETLAGLKLRSDSGVLYSRPTGSVNVLPPPPQPRRTAPNAVAIGAAAVLLVAIVGGGYGWMTRHRALSNSAASSASTNSREETLTNETIVALVAARVAPSIIVSQIRSSTRTDFKLTAAEVIRLSQAGVPGIIIEAMRDPRGEPAPDKPTPLPPSPPAMIAPAAPDAARPSTAAATPVEVDDGLPIRLTLAENISGDAAEGDAVRFTVAYDVLVKDAVVIRKGAGATGAIVDAAKKRILGIGGKMTFRLESVDAADGRKVPIRVTPARRRDGGGPSKRPVDAAPKGSSIAAVAGGEYFGYVDGPQTIVAKK